MSHLNRPQTPIAVRVSADTSPASAEMVLGNVHGWTTRLNYLRARLASPYSTSGELQRAKHGVEEIRSNVNHAQMAIKRMELEASESGFMRDVEEALQQVAAQIRAIDEIGWGATQ